MTYRNLQWITAAAASVGLALLAGCHNDGTTTVPATQPAAANVNFSTFVNQAYSNSANSTPVEVNSIAFNFDVDNQPTYFDNLIAMGTYQ